MTNTTLRVKQKTTVNVVVQIYYICFITKKACSIKRNPVVAIFLIHNTPTWRRLKQMKYTHTEKCESREIAFDNYSYTQFERGNRNNNYVEI